jgi:hypothetical protein
MSDVSEPDLLSQVAGLIAAHHRPNQPEATFRAADATLGRFVGHKVFTVLLHDLDLQQHRRVYSSQPELYPPGACLGPEAFPLWTRPLAAGQACIGRTASDIRRLFFSHEVILSLGCESVLIMPVHWQGRTLGSLTMLHERHWYSEADVPLVRLVAHLVLPAMMLAARG